MTIEFYDIWRIMLIESCRMFESAPFFRIHMFNAVTRQNADRAIQVMALEAIIAVTKGK